jgi:hypothetical protein
MSKEFPKFRVRRVTSAAAGAAPPQQPTSVSQPDAAPPFDASGEPSGRVQFDDRGNAVWDWAMRTASVARTDATQPLQVLEQPSGLSIAEDAPTPTAVLQANPLGLVKGYDPYDSGKLDQKKKAPSRKKDLRKLSEWVQLRKQASNNDPHED